MEKLPSPLHIDASLQPVSQLYCNQFVIYCLSNITSSHAIMLFSPIWLSFARFRERPYFLGDRLSSTLYYRVVSISIIID